MARGGCHQSELKTAINRSQEEAKRLLKQGRRAIGTDLTAAISRWNNCQPELVSLLIQAGAYVNAMSQNGNYALHLALRPELFKHEPDVAVTLIQSGASVNVRNSKGLTPLAILLDHRRLKSNHVRVVEELLKAGANGEIHAQFNHSYSRGGSWFKCLTLLIDYGLTIDSKYLGEYFRLCLEKKHLRPIPSFMKTGTGPDIVKSHIPWRDTPFSIAVVSGQIQLAEYFLENLFVTASDIHLGPRSQTIRNIIPQQTKQAAATFLDELASQPLRLFQISFVAVSDLLGSGPGRKDRVKMVGLPVSLQEKLLFQQLEGELPASVDYEAESSDSDVSLDFYRFHVNDDYHYYDDDSDDFYYDSDW